MGAAISLNFQYVEQEKSYKIINFSSYTIRAIQNVPLIIVGILVLPFFLLFFIPIANFMLWRLYKNLQKEHTKLKQDISSLSYEQTKEGYGLLKSMVLYLENLEKEIAPDANNFMIKGIYNKFINISTALGEMKESLSNALFISADTAPYSEKEKETLDIMNDIWGDDSDQVYARHTHYHLTHKQN